MQNNPSNPLDRAITHWPVALGEAVQKKRESAGMSREFLAQLLTHTMKMPMSLDDIAQIEAGSYPLQGVRLLAALVFLLEISLDDTLLASFRQGVR